MRNYHIYVSELSSCGDNEHFIRLSAALYMNMHNSNLCITSENQQAILSQVILSQAIPSQTITSQAAILRAEHGKPYFSESNMPHFSLSHSGGYIVCAVGDSPCGIDIQEYSIAGNSQKLIRLGKIADRFFHKNEAQAVKKALDSGDISIFFDIWSAKESYVKYTGRGIDSGFADFSVLSYMQETLQIQNVSDAENPCDVCIKKLNLPLPENYSAFMCSSDDFSCTVTQI